MANSVGGVISALSAVVAAAVGVDGVEVSLVEREEQQFTASRRLMAVDRWVQTQHPTPHLGGPADPVAADLVAAAAGDDADPSWDQRSRRGMAAALKVPLVVGGRVLGVLNLYRAATRDWTANDLLVARLVADVAAAYLALAAEQARARSARREFGRGEGYDELTGLPTRWHLLDRLDQAMFEAAGDGTSVAVMLVDIDGFQDINDALGQAVGNVVLREVARRLGLAVRADDTVGRWAAAEFVVVCGGLAGSRARVDHALRTLGRRIRLRLRQAPSAGEVEVVVSASIGVAVTTHRRGAADLIDDADRAVARAKQRGGGQLVIGESTPVAVGGRRSGRSDQSRC